MGAPASVTWSADRGVRPSATSWGCPSGSSAAIEPGGTRRGNPTSIVSDGSLRELAAHAGVESVDGRRFRMLINLEDAVAHEEDALDRPADRAR